AQRVTPIPSFLPVVFQHMAIVTITRRLQFNAAHRVHNPALSDAENKALFGKCNNPNWHGHNYTLDVSVSGPVDDKTGYVVDLSHIKRVVEREVIDKVDHRNFNLEVDFMQGVIPTTENIVVAMWRVIEPAMQPAKLTYLVLWETSNNYVEYDGRCPDRARRSSPAPRAASAWPSFASWRRTTPSSCSRGAPTIFR